MRLSRALLTAALVTLVPGVAAAQLVPVPEPEAPRVCPERPDEPELMKGFDFREAYKSLFVRDMYRAFTFNGIVETGTCSCDQRYPDWGPVVTYYAEHYSSIDDRNELREKNKPYTASINANLAKARDICRAAGNWK